jgi:hypothetical protein
LSYVAWEVVKSAADKAADLAEGALKDKKHFWHEEWHKTIGRLSAELASKGVVGGPTSVIVIELARTEVRTRVEGIMAALLHACDSLDISPTSGLAEHLSANFRRISAPILTLVETNPSAILLLRAQPNRNEAERAFLDNVDSAIRVALDAADAEIRIYVEGLSSKRRRSLWVLLWGVAGTLLGIVATKLADHFWPAAH